MKTSTLISTENAGQMSSEEVETPAGDECKSDAFRSIFLQDIIPRRVTYSMKTLLDLSKQSKMPKDLPEAFLRSNPDNQMQRDNLTTKVVNSVPTRPTKLPRSPMMMMLPNEYMTPQQHAIRGTTPTSDNVLYANRMNSRLSPHMPVNRSPPRPVYGMNMHPLYSQQSIRGSRSYHQASAMMNNMLAGRPMIRPQSPLADDRAYQSSAPTHAKKKPLPEWMTYDFEAEEKKNQTALESGESESVLDELSYVEQLAMASTSDAGWSEEIEANLGQSSRFSKWFTGSAEEEFATIEEQEEKLNEYEREKETPENLDAQAHNALRDISSNVNMDKLISNMQQMEPYEENVSEDESPLPLHHNPSRDHRRHLPLANPHLGQQFVEQPQPSDLPQPSAILPNKKILSVSDLERGHLNDPVLMPQQLPPPEMPPQPHAMSHIFQKLFASQQMQSQMPVFPAPPNTGYFIPGTMEMGQQLPPPYIHSTSAPEQFPYQAPFVPSFAPLGPPPLLQNMPPLPSDDIIVNGDMKTVPFQGDIPSNYIQRDSPQEPIKEIERSDAAEKNSKPTNNVWTVDQPKKINHTKPPKTQSAVSPASLGSNIPTSVLLRMHHVTPRADQPRRIPSVLAAAAAQKMKLQESHKNESENA